MTRRLLWIPSVLLLGTAAAVLAVQGVGTGFEKAGQGTAPGWTTAAAHAAGIAPAEKPESAAGSATTAARTVQFRKGPYMILTHDPSRMTLLWQATATPKTAYVEWGTAGQYDNRTKNLGESDSSPEGHLFTCTLSGLKPATSYDYRVVMDDAVARGAFTTAPPDTAEKVTFYVYGDTRSSPSRHNKVCAAIVHDYRAAPEVRRTFIIHTGDFNTSGSEKDWQSQFFNQASGDALQMMRSLPIVATVGNHEGGGKLLRKYFPYPVTDAYYGYSLDYGPLHVAVVDNCVNVAPDGAQYKWLENDLRTTERPWKIVSFHKPAYSAGGHGNDEASIKHLCPLFTKYKVAMVVAGHNHYYARAEKDGVLHITAGGGGAPTYSPKPDAPAVLRVFKGLHFVRCDIDGRTLQGVVVSAEDGSAVDRFTVQQPD